VSSGDVAVKRASNELYRAVLPVIHISSTPDLGYGLTKQTLTLFRTESLRQNSSMTK